MWWAGVKGQEGVGRGAWPIARSLVLSALVSQPEAGLATRRLLLTLFHAKQVGQNTRPPPHPFAQNILGLKFMANQRNPMRNNCKFKRETITGPECLQINLKIPKKGQRMAFPFHLFNIFGKGAI